MTTYHINGRQTGKTMALLNWLKFYPNGVILVHNQSEKERLLGLPGVVDSQVETVDSWIAGAKDGRSPGPVAVDNIEFMIQHFLGPVDQVTATGELFGEPPR